MTQTISPKPCWEAWPKNDRLKRWCVVNAADPGTGKQVIADNIRQEWQALSIAASLESLAALRAARSVLSSILGTELESRIIAEQVAIIDAALAKAKGAL